MAHHICPVWVGYLLANPLRKLAQNPNRILSSYVKPGMRVMDFGSAMGFFTMPMLKMVQPGGEVWALDIQMKMLDRLERKARRAGHGQSIFLHKCNENSLELGKMYGSFDFILAFAVMHEVPDCASIMNEFFIALKPGGTVLVSEPAGHVTEAEFNITIEYGRRAGFNISEAPLISRGRSKMLNKPV